MYLLLGRNIMRVSAWKISSGTTGHLQEHSTHLEMRLETMGSLMHVKTREGAEKIYKDTFYFKGGLTYSRNQILFTQPLEHTVYNNLT